VNKLMNVKRVYDKESLVGYLSSRNNSLEGFRICAFGDFPNHYTSYGLCTIEGYQNLYQQRFKDVFKMLRDPREKRKVDNRTYLHDWNDRTFGILDMMGVKYYISYIKWVPPTASIVEDTVIAGFEKQYHIYRSEKVFPKWVPFFDWNIYPSSEELMGKMFYSEPEVLRNKALLCMDDISHLNLPPAQPGSAKIIVKHYNPDDIEVLLEATAPGILMIGDMFYPGWQGWRNGKAADIFPVDHIFRGMYFEKGKNLVKLTYKPSYLALSIFLSLTGIVIGGIFLGFTQYRASRSKRVNNRKLKV